MKQSRYNYIIEYKDGFVFFNGLRETSFFISRQNSSYMESILAQPDSTAESVQKYVDALSRLGFIIDDTVDEIALMEQKYSFKRKEHLYSMMILPTYQCNLRCWYCTQKHADLYITPEKISDIKRRIDKMLHNDDIESIFVYWFGGEPLLSYDIIIDINQWIIDECRKVKKTFGSSITTNGTLLTPERINALDKVGVELYQITIDGTKEEHNKTKKLGNLSSFELTLKNVGEVAKYCRCLLRYNYTRENMDVERMIKDIDEALPRENRHNIVLSIHKVWQEDVDSVSLDEILQLMDSAVGIGIRPELATLDLCYTDQKHFDCVFSNGLVGKCDNSPLEKANGVIRDDGEIEWTEDILSYSPILEYENCECKECRYLPICWGPCQGKRSKMVENGNIYCQFKDKDSEILPMILNSHINFEYKKKYMEYSSNHLEK